LARVVWFGGWVTRCGDKYWEAAGAAHRLKAPARGGEPSTHARL
jgi:hypothetical protein